MAFSKWSTETSLDLKNNYFQTASPNHPIRATTKEVEWIRVIHTSHHFLALPRMPEAHPYGVRPPPLQLVRIGLLRLNLTALAKGQSALQTTGIDFTHAQLGCLHRTDELLTQSYTAFGNCHTIGGWFTFLFISFSFWLLFTSKIFATFGSQFDPFLTSQCFTCIMSRHLVSVQRSRLIPCIFHTPAGNC